LATQQQKIKVIGEGNLTSQTLNVRPFDTATSITLFDMGTSRVTTNLAPAVLKTTKSRIVTLASQVTLESLRIKSLEKARTIRQYSDKIFLRPDRTAFTSYSYFGSLVELLRVSLNQIIASWPGSIYVNPDLFTGQDNSGVTLGTMPTTSAIGYDSANDITTFTISSVMCENTHDINLNTYQSDNYATSDLKNLTQEFQRYCLDYNGQTYPILGFTGLASSSAHYLQVTVRGEPFANTVKLNGVLAYHIRPNVDELNLYQHKLTDLGKYLLNLTGNPPFQALFRYPSEEDEDDVTEYTAIWPSTDGFNPDFIGGQFNEYQDTLFAIAQAYDNTKTNLLVRRLVPTSLLDNDQTYSAKMSQLLQTYGREFDKVKAFIDGLAHLNTVTYDRLDNVPDAMILNLARTLGWETFPIAADDSTLLDAVFTPSVQYGDATLTPAEVDIELWRRVSLNSTWLLQSKGTRHALEALLGLVGAPEALLEFNEYIYLAEKRIRIVTDEATFNFPSVATPESPVFTPETPPIFIPDAPTEAQRSISAPQSIQSVQSVALQTTAVQAVGQTDPDEGNLITFNEPILNPDYPTPPLFTPFQNQAPDDYIQAIADEGFRLTRTVDSKKSWPVSSGTSRDHLLTHTQYVQGDSAMVVNSKEVSINLNPAQAVESDVYASFANFLSNSPVSVVPPQYPQIVTFYEDQVPSFIQFTNLAYSRFINAQSRKTSRGYPTLQKLYQDYVAQVAPLFSNSVSLTIPRILNFASRVGNSWNQLLEQIIPATTIVVESGLQLRNTLFQSQKHSYKPGIDAGSEFQSLVPPLLTDDIFIGELTAMADTGLGDTIYIGEIYGEAIASDKTNVVTDSFASLSSDIKVGAYADMAHYQFTPPTFGASGATKIAPISPNSSAIFTYNDMLDKTMSIAFSTNDMAQLSGATGADFGLLVYRYDPDNKRFQNAPVYRRYFGRETLSGLTANQGYNLSVTIPRSVLAGNEEYLVKGFFTKTLTVAGFKPMPVPVTPYSYYDNFVQNVYPQQFRTNPKFYNRTTQLPLSAVTVSSEPLNIPATGLNLPYGLYDANKDFYFLSVGNPSLPTPGFGTTPIGTTSESFSGYTSIPVSGFTISNTPLLPVRVYKNSKLLALTTDYTADTRFSGSAVGYNYTLTTPLVNNDVLTAVYLTDFQAVKTPLLTLPIPAKGVNKDYTNTGANATQPYFNMNTNNLEIVLSNSVPAVGSVTVYENTTLITGATISTPGLVIPNYLPTTGSTLYVRYQETSTGSAPTSTVAGDGFPLTMNPPTFDFSLLTPLEDSTSGHFTVDVAAVGDYSFSTILYSLDIPFTANASRFTATLDELAASGVQANSTYLLRVTAHQMFSALTGDDIETVSGYNMYKVRFGDLGPPPSGSRMSSMSTSDYFSQTSAAQTFDPNARSTD
jgi:hypothetical protein